MDKIWTRSFSSNSSSSPMALAEAISALITEASLQFAQVRPLLPLFSHIILSALFPIFTGAHASLSRPSSAAKPDKKRKDTGAEEDEEDEEKVQKMEGLSNKDAIVLPITAGLTLAGLYFLIMKYGADVINLVIGYYFAAIGVFSVGRLVNDAANIIVGFIFPNYFRYKSSLSDKHGVLMHVVSSQREVVRQDGTGQIENATGLPVPNPLVNLNLSKWMRSALWSLRLSLKQKYALKGYLHNILEFAINLTLINIVSGLVGLGIIVYVNTVSKLWFFTNLQGFALSYQALQLLSPTSFTTGSLILSALFFYDIWAVFFTPLMVGVAKNLNQPIALVFPRPSEPSAVPGEPPVKSFSMLGLGDIVIPGILIGLALRFDLYMFYLKKQRNDKKKATYVSVTGRWGDKFWTSGLPYESLPPHLRTSFPKPYFIASVIGYVTGMVATLGVMTVFHHAQPALLYLVPGVLLSLWSTALVRGELRQMWEFSEAVTAEQVEADGGEKAKKEEKVEKSNRGLFAGMWHDLWHGGDEIKKEEDKKVDKSVKSKSIKSKKQSKDTANTKTKDKSDSGLLFSFSFSRLQSESTASSKTSSTEDKPDFNLEKTDSAAHSESSEDPVLVSSADLDGTNEAANKSTRYRTRSSKESSS